MVFAYLQGESEDKSTLRLFFTWSSPHLLCPYKYLTDHRPLLDINIQRHQSKSHSRQIGIFFAITCTALLIGQLRSQAHLQTKSQWPLSVRMT